MKFYNRKQLLTLKAKIKGLANEGRRTREILQTKSGDTKWNLWQIKREIGLETRLYLIAYGLLRGKRFSEIEPNTKVCSALPKHPKPLDYQHYFYWESDFPWQRLLDIIRANCPGISPDRSFFTINGCSFYADHKYWTLKNLKNLVLHNKPLSDEELYSARTLERVRKVS